ncbi:MAG: PolC-type DNA polymerase III [Selenomonadaceae bacterium]|nr:PolC-type DNA polymerase III [Selenomonadaceae bacterium]
MKDDQFMISGIREERFKEMISGLKLSFDEQESLSGSCISLVNVIPSDKFVEIFLQTQNNISKILLYKLAVYLKNKYNPNGEIKVSPRPKNDQGSLFEDEEERQRRYSGISSNDPPPTARRKIINKNTSKVVGKIDQSTNNFVDQSKKISTVDENKNQSTVEEKIISKSEEIAKPQPQPSKPIKGSITAINQLTDDKSKVTIEGVLSDLKIIETSKGKIIMSFNLVDESDGIICKKFYDKKEKSTVDELMKNLQGQHKLKVRGSSQIDSYSKELTFWIDNLEIEKIETNEREDNSDEKRVELHCHTRMSQMDAIMSASEIVEQAAKWNWKAVAITDHGVVQAFPEAANTAKKLKKQGINIKIIYGVEGYLVGEDYQTKAQANHIIILAKNKIGLKNLYELISLSHLRFFYRTARIPKKILSQYREGLIIGSACEAGELIRAIVAEKSDEEIEEIANFYDYLEIQPIHNNDFLKRSEDFPNVNTDDDLININLKVAELAKKLNKPLVATCDAHFMNKEDYIYRAILMQSKGYKDADKQPPLYLRTTEEMLKEFDYLGEELAKEAVIINPNKIADQVEILKPIPELLYSPKLEGADDELRETSYRRAKELYGDPLPEIVQARLEQEIKPIIGHGFAALYMIAERLVKKSNADGYIVGSRGSVGSSFVATMLGITEVNPLPPHWHCPKCKHSEFIIDGTVNCGYDLDDKICPECGEKMIKDGHDIPFAVFLGFDGDKVPDIDLNFSGEYQARAHKYTEILFGKYNVYRAGTIATVADKTAYGIVKKYYEEHNETKNGAFISNLANHCQGVKRTTGQHPAGIMVVPRDMDVHFFTPLQHPADDKESKIITTHFDYHSISERLVKLDILGHDDPTVLKMLEDLTGIKINEIPLDDKETMSLFTSTKAIGVDPKLLGTNTGTFGIPEFRTSFTRAMVDDTKPNCFSDLVRISGFSHGTDVWLGNAQDLIKNGTCTLKNAISARDDIMTYLIYKGVDPLLSFKTMEGVRKGKGISDEVAEELKKNNVPEWYIESCRKIKYLFPKAHATAYVIMAFRIAWFKVHYPLAFYAAYFTSRGDEFNSEEIVQGDQYVQKLIRDLENKPHLDVKETAKLTMLQVAHEMFLRNYGVENVNLYESDASKFIIRENKLLPPFSTLHGLGDIAAKNIVETRQVGEFSSIDDLKKRANLNKTNIEVLKKHGCLKGMPESAQQDLFTFEN